MEYTEEKVFGRLNINKDKPSVYLIGDSSCMGYREYVRDALSEDYNVVFPEENARCSQYVLIMLRGWSGICESENIRLVQFNTGHWDIAHWNDEAISLNSVEEYVNNMLRIAATLKRMYKNAKIVYATTMPMNPNGENSVNFRYTYEIEKYNAAASEALLREGIAVNDLFAVAKNFTSEAFADYCHLTDKANSVIADHTARFIKNLLEK